ncbi:MAG: 3-hydroxyacyl-ACP dehydratase, partial [Pelosinus sp.]|nr:3-hydroxyacyl-ACP dehydratase [Pelosinus sp.]
MEIETLLPQRYPFLFVDELIAVSAEEIVGIKTYARDFLFYQELLPDEKVVPPTILIESIIQCGGAGVTKLGIFPRARWRLAALENIRIYDWVRPNQTVKMVTKNIKVSSKVLKQTGIAFCNEKKI